MSARRHDVVTIPTIRVAFVLSLLVHAALLWLVWPHLRSLTQAQESAATSPLAVQLVPHRDALASAAPPRQQAMPPASAAASPRRAEPAPVPRKRPSQPPKATPGQAPTIIARRAPSPTPIEQPRPAPAPAPRPAPVPAPSPAAPPALQPMPAAPAQDLASYVEAQRRARGEAPQAPSPGADTNGENDIARRDRIVASNLGLGRTPTFGTDARNAGGLFQITELGYDDAQFYFVGFDKAIGRNARQLIEVRKGAAPDIRIAIVRKMVAIIRENVSGDFQWVSQRLGRTVTLSARPADDAGLEDFILHDIFPDARLS